MNDDHTQNSDESMTERLVERSEALRDQLKSKVQQASDHLPDGDHVKKVVNKAKARTKQTASDTAQWGSAHPVAMAVLGASAGLAAWALMRGPSNGSAPRSDGPNPGEFDPLVSVPAQRDLTGGSMARSDDGRSWIDRTRSRAEQARDDMNAWGTEQAAQLRRHARDGANQVSSAVQAHPLAVGFATAAAGFMTGLLVPNSRAENRVLDKPADLAKQQLAAAAETGEDAVRAAWNHARSAAAEELGIDPAGGEGRAEASVSEHDGNRPQSDWP